MKKVLFIFVFMLFSSVAFKAAASTCNGTTDCSGCDPGSGPFQQATCCSAVLASFPGNYGSAGCMTVNAPINKGLIFLLIAGVGLGSFVVYKKRDSTPV